MVEFSGLNHQGNASLNSVGADVLTREILEHREEDKKRSYLGKLVYNATEGIHGSQHSLDRMDSLLLQSMLAQKAADSRGLAEAQKQMQDAVAQDREARKSAYSWTSHSTNFAKSIGLFFPGKGAYVASAILGAADAVHPEDSLGRQTADAFLGAGKGAALKFTFDKVGKSEMNIALKGATMSLGNRFAELGLDSHTYFDKTGVFDPLGGAWKTAKTVADPYQLGNDLLTFGAGYYALKKIGFSPELAKTNPFAAQAITGAGFGFSSGFFSDLQMQKKLGEGFDFSSALKSAVLQMGLDGTAAALGGAKMQQINNASALPDAPSVVAPKKAGLSSEHVIGVYGLDSRPVARPLAPIIEGLAKIHSIESAKGSNNSGIEISSNFVRNDLHHAELASAGSVNISSRPETGLKATVAESKLREFVSSEDISSLIPRLREQGLNGQALLQVREILGHDGARLHLGPEQSLLVRHLDAATKVDAINMQGADLLASCSPELLQKLGLADLQAKHIFPDAGAATVLLQVPGSNRLRFSLTDGQIATGDGAITLGGPKAGRFPETGMTVSEWLRSLSIKDRMSDLHDIPLIARAMEPYKAPIRRFLGGGNETIALEMNDGRVLRITEKPFLTEWGKRTIKVDWKEVQFDASILGPRMQVNVDGKLVNYYEQPRGITPVSRADLARFEEAIELDGRYVFWDNDGASWGQSQLAYVPLSQRADGTLTAIPVPGRAASSHQGMALIDYDAVRIAGTEPKQDAGRGSWRYGRYDFEAFER